VKYWHVGSSRFRDDYPHRFTQADADALVAFLRSAPVRPMREAWSGEAGIYLRHDIDHNIEHAVAFAEWEAALGIRASYYVLHTAWYYEDEAMVRRGMERLVELGHEVGLHQDAVAEAWRRGSRSAGPDASVMPAGDCAVAADIVRAELDRLRRWGFEIVGSATHGTHLWREAQITNSFLWAAGYVPADFGLQYEAYQLHRRAHYISDNRGAWSEPLRLEGDQTHILTHPCHWPARELVP
jgi:hypothetical protein